MKPGWEGLLGHERVTTTLRRASQSGRPHGAYLLLGPRGVGKATVAQVFARALVCERPIESPCGLCPSCIRTAAGTHPDFWVEAPTGAATTITVDQVAEVQRKLSYRRAEGRFRVVVFDDAHALQGPAQNKLLKTLEEPPPATVLILVAVHPAQLLQTVRSRCLKLVLGELKLDTIGSWLQREHGAAPVVAEHAAARSQGAPGRALVLLDSTQQDEDASTLSLAVSALSGDKEAITALSQSVDRDRDGALSTLLLLQELLRDAMVAATGAAVPALHTGADPWVGRLRERSSLDLAQLVSRVEVVRSAIRRQVHPGGALEDFLLHLESSSLGGSR